MQLYMCNGRCRGFTLIEALIAFMILSIGMLGIASLQAVSLQAGKTSVYGSIAVMKVDELFESMRSNPTALLTYAGGGVNNACSGANNCSVTELAQDDVYWWKQNLKVGLPDSAATVVAVTPAVAPSRMATVKVEITWNERNIDTTDGAASSISRTYSATAHICTAVPC